MAKRPTITDVARAAGVSVATVDRVLNARLPVREATARQVCDAAEALGYHAAGLLQQRLRADLPEVRLGFLLLRPQDAFYRAFADELASVVASTGRFRGVATIDFTETLDPEDTTRRLRRLAARSRAVALVSPDHPTLTAAVADLRSRGTPVFALLSDFATGVRDGYVGTDNLKFGRTAAWMIARAAPRPGKVALFVGSHRFHGHELREIGFRAHFREHAPAFTLLDTCVNHESAQATREMLTALLREHPDLAGCYVAGGGAEGAVATLRALRPPAPPVLVCNELTADNRAALAEGLVTMVLATPLPAICRAVVEAMAQAIEATEARVPLQRVVPFDIHLPESI